MKSDGAIYFTDPMGFTPAHDQWDMTSAGVYRVSGDRGTTLCSPTGSLFTRRERADVDEYLRGHARAFDVAPNGTSAEPTDHIFADLRGPEPGAPAGNVYCEGSGGIYALGPKGNKLGRIIHGYPDDEHRIRRRRLENLVLHHSEHTWVSDLKIAGTPSADLEEIMIEISQLVTASTPVKALLRCRVDHPPRRNTGPPDGSTPGTDTNRQAEHNRLGVNHEALDLDLLCSSRDRR